MVLCFRDLFDPPKTRVFVKFDAFHGSFRDQKTGWTRDTLKFASGRGHTSRFSQTSR